MVLMTKSLDFFEREVAVMVASVGFVDDEEGEVSDERRGGRGRGRGRGRGGRKLFFD